MYAGFGGLSVRSRSTTDVYRASRQDDTASQEPGRQDFGTLRRGMRRPRDPTPPVRSSTLGPGSYLSDRIRHRYQLGYETATPAPTSPSNSFVKELVATLERRQLDGNLTIGRPPGPLLPAKKHELENNAPPRGTLPPKRRSQQLQPIIRAQRTLTDLREDADEDTSAESEDDFWRGESEDIVPILVSGQPSGPSSAGSSHSSFKNNARRAFRKISSLIGWRTAKGLPKGTRDYYATRESLSDEMGAFRRDTLARMIREAPDPSPRDDELARIMGPGAPPPPKPPRRSITATIRPIYGGKTAQQDRPSNHAGLENEKEPIYGSSFGRVQVSSLQQPAVTLRQPRIRQEAHRRPASFDSALIYDVPRSNRPVSFAALGQQQQQPVYANAEALIGTGDKRLNPPGFTTF